jgi:pyrroline-5-carboxylate reductase
MASAIIGGLLSQGFALSHVHVVEPFEEARTKLHGAFGIKAHAEAGDFLKQAGMVVWAVKPQTFKEAALQVAPFARNALHLSVAAGIRSDSIAQWLHTQRVIRTMPNTPALIGKGITALVARAGVSPADKDWASAVIQTTGEVLWLNDESQIDAVTALSGSGPAYMFYFMEAMREAGTGMGLDPAQAYQLAVATFIGAGGTGESLERTPGSVAPARDLQRRYHFCCAQCHGAQRNQSLLYPSDASSARAGQGIGRRVWRDLRKDQAQNPTRL